MEFFGSITKMLVSEFKASKTFSKLPDFIKYHSIFNKIKRIEKIFPDIGLLNTLEKYELGIDGKPSYIGFSSVGISGAWDIATMSMRGVCSCMHWNNNHSTHLVGSITDPFLGIIYLSDNDMTQHGIKFNYRSLVRFTYSQKDEAPVIFIERLYKDTGNTDPQVYRNKDLFPHEKHKIFINFLKKKLNNKYRILSPHAIDAKDAYPHIPYFTSVNLLEHKYISMSDSLLRHEGIVNAGFIKKYQDQNQ